MKRKRQERIQSPDFKSCDFVLTDSEGKSVRVHKALLIDKSDYFSQLLTESDLTELKLDEKYLVEMIRYLYNHEGYYDDYNASANPTDADSITLPDQETYDDNKSKAENSDIEILMHLLCLSRRYYFRQLYVIILNEIEFKLNPQTVIPIYQLAKELGISELHDSTRLLILSWLPSIQKTKTFHSLPVELINDIFENEDSDIDKECKLNALSVWWAHNKDKDMTGLWVKLIGCASSSQ